MTERTRPGVRVREIPLVILIIPPLLVWVLFCGIGWLVLTLLAGLLRCLFLKRAARLMEDLAWELWA